MGNRLVFQSVSKEDEGMYLCRGSNSQGVGDAQVIPVSYTHLTLPTTPYV